MNIYQFMSESPILTFFIVYFIIQGVGSVIIKVNNKILRAITLFKHGYPPNHWDADGNSKEEKSCQNLP